MKLQELFESEERNVLFAMGKQPDRIEGSFDCSEYHLTSLKGAPSYVGGSVNARRNEIGSLEFAPSFIERTLNMSYNGLTTLHNIHKQIKHIGKWAGFEHNPITSCVLGLLLIDGLVDVWMDNKKVEGIINKHLQGDRDVFACQEELIDNDLEEFAKL